MPPAKRQKVSPKRRAPLSPSTRSSPALEALASPNRLSSTELNKGTTLDKENISDRVEVSAESIDQSGGGDLVDTGRVYDDSDDFEQPQIEDWRPGLHGKGHGHYEGYDALKTFNGQVYRGMAVGGSHTWNYDSGVWKETKVEPDLWQVDFETTKRRAKAAPKGSGAPVGTEYHWLIVSHQYVKKIDANTYKTHLVGSKYKLAHKNATAGSWSIPKVAAQRAREVELLEDAKRRVEGLPPVLASEKVKVDAREKGQQKLDALFSKSPTTTNGTKAENKKRRASSSISKE